MTGGASDATLRWHFTGKEDQGPDFGTAYTDFGARQYSPSLGSTAPRSAVGWFRIR